MHHKLLNLAAAVSLVASLASAALWVRSFWVSDWVVLIHRHAPMRTSSAGAATLSGLFSVDARYAGKSDYGDPRNTIFQYNRQVVGGPMISSIDPSAARWLGFGGSISRKHLTVIAPGWFVALIWAAAAALIWRRARRLRLIQRSGLCPTCGYDLRATPDRCPECGTVPEGAKGAAT
jgi:hypothetical protein